MFGLGDIKNIDRDTANTLEKANELRQSLLNPGEHTFTHGQLTKMMEITRNWILSDPSGPLPPLPLSIELAKNKEELYSSLPPYKSKPNE